jgi:hypothetical protein
MKIAVVIPSRGRPNCHPAVGLFHNPILCIPESDRAEYAAAHPKTRLLAHPADLRGLGRVRQWILDQLEEDCVFMCDDDVVRVTCVVGNRQRHILDPNDVHRIIENSANIANDLGTTLFGYSHTPDTRHFLSFRPFSFAGYVNGLSMGIIGRSIRFDPELDTKQDIDFSLQVLLRRRFLWRDNRFAFVAHDWFKLSGGSAGVRTSATLAKNIAHLKKKWGPAVEVNHFSNSKKGKHQNIHIHVQR